LLNNPLIAQAAHAMAERVVGESPGDAPQQVRGAFELALQRMPDELEMAVSSSLLTKRSLAELCRALLNLNEFVYVD